MTLNELRYVVAVARERHFGRAAEACFVSQPTLSVAVKKLEDEFGVSLFERGASEVTVTSIGQEIVAQAQRVLEEADGVRRLARQGSKPLAGPLRLGAIYTVGPYLLPQLIPLVMQLAPDMPLMIEENFTAVLAGRLKRGDLDVIVVSLPFDEPGILTRPLYDEPFVVLLPVSHPWTALAAIEVDKLGEHVKQLVDRGASLVYVHGIVADQFVMAGQIDALGRAIQAIKAQGLPAGVGGHSLETPMACEKHALGADFYVKTFHTDRYWSATPPENREEWCWYRAMSSEHGRYYDNMFCLDADKVAAFMESLDKPWIAFKTMAAGAIPPRLAFPFAFRQGADFIVAGMFDFQLEQDAKLAIEAIQRSNARKRPWHG